MNEVIFNTIKEALLKIVEIQSIELWNQNIDFIEQEELFDCPAVFVEFGSVVWNPFIGGNRRGIGSVKLHIVTEFAEGGNESAWNLLQKIRVVMEQLKGENFQRLMLTESFTNHNHDEILDNIDTYSLRVTI